MNCKTCLRTSCGDYGQDNAEKAKNCSVGYKGARGAPNPPGHKVTEASHLPGFTPPSDVDLAKAAKQEAFLKR